ncbi:crossover junction endonuclease MUS81 [Anopheles bellator]|uniref:crossover junction endonuclease MUS81 n=1 Tax=Anopheles bellator TaxID=139047 RepID=UPI002647E1CB|nr:crossover junction endonuclease MUS81 [Anopheles bellator]
MPPVKYDVRIVKNSDATDPSSPLETERWRRISARIKRPNPLFEAWLEEMIAKAEEKNSMGKIALQKALVSLRRYPLPLASGRDCIVLVDFGKTICENLDRRLKSYLACGGRVETDHHAAIEAILNDEKEEHYTKLTSDSSSPDITEPELNAIVERYPTPQCLRRAYDRCPSETERQRMLNLPYGPTKRTIGDKLSAIIYHLFTSDRYMA